MTPERCAEIERMWAGGMGHVDILRDWVRELLTAMREAQHRVKVFETGLRGTGCEPHIKVIDALQRRVEGLETLRPERVSDCCRRIFEEDWDCFSERPTLMDAIQRHVEAALRGEACTRIVVIAGTYEQYRNWLRVTGTPQRDAAYVNSPDQIRGLHGVKVVRTGEWWKNPLVGDPYLVELERSEESG